MGFIKFDREKKKNYTTAKFCVDQFTMYNQNFPSEKKIERVFD